MRERDLHILAGEIRRDRSSVLYRKVLLLLQPFLKTSSLIPPLDPARQTIQVELVSLLIIITVVATATAAIVQSACKPTVRPDYCVLLDATAEQVDQVNSAGQNRIEEGSGKARGGDSVSGSSPTTDLVAPPTAATPIRMAT